MFALSPTMFYIVLHVFEAIIIVRLLSCRNVGSCRLQCQVPWVLNVLDSSKTELSTLTKNKKRCLNQTYWIKVQLLYQYLSISHSCLVFFLVFFISYSLFYLRIYVCIFLSVLLSPTVSIWILNPYLVLLYMCTLIIPALNKFTCVHITV